MPKTIDLTGQKFGQLTAIENGQKTKQGRITWVCECECGNRITVTASNLHSGNTGSCGCSKKALDLTGQRFGQWTVIARNGINRFKAIMWLCRCDCGKESRVSGSQLQQKRSMHCGCVRIEAAKKRVTTHGRWGTPEHQCWHAMLQRCRNPNAAFYYCYGGRGITVCERWTKFEHFFEDMGPKPTLKHSIDRIDNNGNYEPGNCRWATIFEQNNNTRRNIKNRTQQEKEEQYV